ncbi:heavy metal translocating P-type ATPase [Mycolicibacterium fallax]|uniref:Cation-transporting P-type ATPase B n=1 Tax=Mycolicibacterium fallax TaxID=1793 RepID=A0A1X1R4T4_MYCFA|nr:heavy metal translocating P-type ATPase [Mycolicibacterium fallax]ORU99300.1 cation-transporting ATPase [Mycolicibacterium fallax]BBY97784.1 carbonate dehydratase [Mycolicibacterium fallax]HOW93631.1 heavy metal translocating P-type ATPase [Mycolicibacterium fallax]
MTAEVIAEPDAAPHRVRLDVGGMSCAACAARVETKLNRQPGVHASVNFATGVATIDAPGSLDEDALCEVVTKAGYEASPHVEGAGPGRDTDSDTARELMRRLAVAAVLFVPLADLSVMFAVVPSSRFDHWQWVLLALAAPIVTWGAWPFHRVALRNARHRTASMETLISVGVTSATVWSLYTMFGPSGADTSRPDGIWAALTGSDSIYLEVAAGVTVFVLAGRYFEARAKSQAGSALRALAALSAKNAAVLMPDGSELVIPAGELKEQQKFVVRPGQTIAADGLVVDGGAAIDMSAMTGEATPVRADAGDQVIGGTVVLDGRLVVEAAAVGADTRFAGMVRLVEEAQAQKADAQRLADRISAVFVPAVFVIAAATLTGWLLAGAGSDKAFGAALAVLVIACPCALGLATPTAMMVASGRGAQLGIFLKGYRALEAIRAVDTVVFDKTGTLTIGRPTVTEVTVTEGWQRSEVLAVAAAVESASEHAVAVAITTALADAEPPEVTEFVATAGRGVSGLVDGRRVEVGRPAWVTRGGDAPASLSAARRCAEHRGETLVYVSVDDEVCGAIAVADTVKKSAPNAIAALHERGLRTVLLTGDNAATAGAVAEQVGIEEAIADVLPEGKVDVIEQLREQGRVVAMVGDGINDGPALASADLGLAIGRGTDVAIGAADVILVRDNLDVVPQALDLARATMRTIKVNLAWAFGYNVAAIPIAAAGLLNPLIAGAAMAFSSFFVVSNSLRLRKFGTR